MQKNCQYRLMCVEAVESDISVVFMAQCMYVEGKLVAGCVLHVKVSLSTRCRHLPRLAHGTLLYLL